MNIYVGNLSSDVNDSDLEAAFSKFGKVSSAKVIKDMFSQESKGFGFVEMQGKTEAASAIEELNTSDLKGKNIIVNEAKPKKNTRGGGSRNRRY
jgi:RNA recognition motif-containing protein